MPILWEYMSQTLCYQNEYKVRTEVTDPGGVLIRGNYIRVASLLAIPLPPHVYLLASASETHLTPATCSVTTHLNSPPAHRLVDMSVCQMTPVTVNRLGSLRSTTHGLISMHTNTACGH